MKKRKIVTMLDIAEAAGVSVATVSHVVNRTAKISAETTEKVETVMTQLGYKPRRSAELNHGNRTIGVFIPDISNEFYACVVQGIFEEAWKNDYAVVVCNIRHHHKAEASYIRSLLQNNIKGLIFCGGMADDESYILNAMKHIPVVLCDRKLSTENVDSVGTDNITIMRQMIKKLARYGYKNIGYISEDPVMSNAYDRYLGFRLGMEENNLKIDPKWTLLLPELRLGKIERANRLMIELLEKKEALPQVILCSSDLIAIGVMAALREKGYGIPKDIGVIGFDNISQASYSSPPLTTVAQDMYQLGARSFKALINRIENPKQVPEEITLQGKIVIRDSVKL